MEVWKYDNDLGLLTLYLPDQICNSHYCQPYNSYNVSYYHQIDIFCILTTYLVDIVLIL